MSKKKKNKRKENKEMSFALDENGDYIAASPDKKLMKEFCKQNGYKRMQITNNAAAFAVEDYSDIELIEESGVILPANLYYSKCAIVENTSYDIKHAIEVLNSVLHSHKLKKNKKNAIKMAISVLCEEVESIDDVPLDVIMKHRQMNKSYEEMMSFSK